MINIEKTIFGSLLAVVLVCTPAFISPAGPVPAGFVAMVPDDSTGSAVGRYTTDGGKTWTVVREEKGVVERLPAGTKQVDFMAGHQMAPEAEAKIVHQIPEVPVVIDGVLYQPEDIHKFGGQQLGFTLGADGRLYAFTDETVLEDFISKQQLKDGFFFPLSIYSRFCEGYYLSGTRQLEVPPGISVYDLGTMNNIISSMEVVAAADNGITLFDLPNLQGDYFHGYYGISYPNLGWYGWDNRASSLVVWPQ